MQHTGQNFWLLGKAILQDEQFVPCRRLCSRLRRGGVRTVVQLMLWDLFLEEGTRVSQRLQVGQRCPNTRTQFPRSLDPLASTLLDPPRLLEWRIKEHPSRSRWTGLWFGALTLRVTRQGLGSLEPPGWLSQAARSIDILSIWSMRWDRKVGKHRLDLLNLHLSQKPAGGAGVSFLPEPPPHRIPGDTSHRHSHPSCMNGVPCSLPRVSFYPVEACGGPVEAIGVDECLSICGGEFQDFLHLCFSLCLTQK